jgi:hypothetical protein
MVAVAVQVVQTLAGQLAVRVVELAVVVVVATILAMQA